MTLTSIASGQELPLTGIAYCLNFYSLILPLNFRSSSQTTFICCNFVRFYFCKSFLFLYLIFTDLLISLSLESELERLRSPRSFKSPFFLAFIALYAILHLLIRTTSFLRSSQSRLGKTSFFHRVMREKYSFSLDSSLESLCQSMAFGNQE